MPLRLRLKQGDRLIIGEAIIDVDRIGLTSLHLVIDAPQSQQIARLRNPARQRGGRFVEKKIAPPDPR